MPHYTPNMQEYYVYLQNIRIFPLFLQESCDICAKNGEYTPFPPGILTVFTNIHGILGKKRWNWGSFPKETLVSTRITVELCIYLGNIRKLGSISQRNVYFRKFVYLFSKETLFP